MIDSWESFYTAVKQMREMQKEKLYLKHERERLEAEVDAAIKNREKRLHSMRQKTFEMIGEYYE